MKESSYRSRKGAFVLNAIQSLAVDLRDQVADLQSDTFSRTAGQHRHHLHPVILRIDNDSGAVEGHRSPVFVLLQIQLSPNLVEGAVELPEHALTEVGVQLAVVWIAL